LTSCKAAVTPLGGDRARLEVVKLVPGCGFSVKISLGLERWSAIGDSGRCEEGCFRRNGWWCGRGICFWRLLCAVHAKCLWELEQQINVPIYSQGPSERSGGQAVTVTGPGWRKPFHSTGRHRATGQPQSQTSQSVSPWLHRRTFEEQHLHR
jgi:hypothetical protein